MGRRCPRCSGTDTAPADADGWWCADCRSEFPTTAYTCSTDGCDDRVVGFGDFCERHDVADGASF